MAAVRQMILVHVEYVGGRRFMWLERHPRELFERVSEELLAECPASLDGLAEVYRSPLWNMVTMTTARHAPMWRCLLRWRDVVARSWFEHCRNLQVIPQGGRAPWPRWACVGW